MAFPDFHIIAGCNGAGKSSFAHAYLPPGVEYVNADDIARLLPPELAQGRQVQAGKLALRRISALEQQQTSFAYETTLSGLSLAVRLRRMRAAGYRVILYYVWLRQDDLAVARVAARVQRGGHDIPEADIRRRYVKGLINFLDVYLPLADTAYIYNNTAISRRSLSPGRLRAEQSAVRIGLCGTKSAERHKMSENKPVENTDTVLINAHELGKVTRAFQDAVAHAYEEYQRAGNPVPLLQNGHVVWVDPATIIGDAIDAAPLSPAAAAEN